MPRWPTHAFAEPARASDDDESLEMPRGVVRESQREKEEEDATRDTRSWAEYDNARPFLAPQAAAAYDSKVSFCQ